MSCHMVLKIATTGLVVSCLLHLATFTDYDFPGEVADKILLVLFLGLMTVWIPTYQVGKRLRERLPSADVPEVRIPMRWGYTLPFASTAVRTLYFLCLAYVLFTGLRGMALQSAGSGPPASASRAPLEIPHCGVHMVLLYCCGSSIHCRETR